MPLDRPSIHFARRALEPTTSETCRFSRARQLAAEIEALLGSPGDGERSEEREATGYAVRLAQGLTRSLIDQLEELHLGPTSSRRLRTPESASSAL